MTLRDPGVHLEDIERYAEAAMRFTAGFDLAAYLADDKTRAAVERAWKSAAKPCANSSRIAPDVAQRIRTHAKSSAFATSSRTATPDSITPGSFTSSSKTRPASAHRPGSIEGFSRPGTQD